ncbi:MAG: glycogen/starch synthase [Dehalococcoidia bacterium]
MRPARPLRIVFASAEATPYSKVGGLADVAGSLPKALAARGHEVLLITPLHKPAATETAAATHEIAFQGSVTTVQIVEDEPAPGVRAVLVGDEKYFPRDSVYEQADDLDRYLFFCQSVLELPKLLGWQPDILHLNDWHTGPAAYALRNYAWDDEFYRGVSSIFTIHNLRYRGPDRFLDLLGPAIFYSDVVTTVSPTYAAEILTPELGEGLHELLNLRKDSIYGVLNGIDYDEFDPATDSRIAANFSVDDLSRRPENKATLQRQLGLAESPLPVAGMVARLSEQKGIDITLEAAEPLLAARSLQLVILGTGDKQYEEAATALAARHPDNASVTIGFDAKLAQQIYAGSDLFLMPSRFEPCGLGQMIAMRYGSIPVVRRTGGLADTVPDVSSGREGLGFVFEDYSAEAMRKALERAITHYSGQVAWGALQRRAMAADHSWSASAARYEDIYLQTADNRA